MVGSGEGDPPSRPLGISILAILILLVGLGLVVRGILGLVNGGEGSAGILVSAVLVIVGLAYALVARGIWNGNRASRVIVTILTAIAFIGSVVELADPAQRLASTIQIIVSVVILVLLYGRRARAYFD